jgi:ABC-2 type transport system ATP-binding protein
MKTLTCNGLCKQYGKKNVLQDVNLTLEAGKIYGLIGRNGAGKTTLLGVVSGQNPSSAGTVTLDGQPVWENQSVIDQICFSREITSTAFGFAADARKAKQILKTASFLFSNWDQAYADQLLKEFAIDIKKKISQMSKGMLSALCIVVGMASKAPLTFLDEPVAGLDVFARETFYRLLMEEFASSQRTFVVSTHIVDEAAKAFDEVIILNEGTVLRKENTEELLERHRIVSGREDQMDGFLKHYKVIHRRDVRTHQKRLH